MPHYTAGNLAWRMLTRQLYTYPQMAGKTAGVVPDLAVDPPVVTDGGCTLRGHRSQRRDVRHVTGPIIADAVRRSRSRM
jgi:hypothetical protein